MFLDGPLVDAWRARTARDHGVDILIQSWSGIPAAHRAAMILAQGDVHRAGAVGGEGWSQLAKGDIVSALRHARNADGTEWQSVPMVMLEAEALFTAGAVVAGLNRLRDIYNRGDAAATLALARRHHMLGDHEGAERFAMELPMNVHAALVGARATLMLDRPGAALRFMEPFLYGAAPIPEPGTAGAVAVVTASALAKSGEHDILARFAGSLLQCEDLADDMMPTVARTAWIAGLGQEAWDRFSMEENTWMAMARLELATLTGDLVMATTLMKKAGMLAATAQAALVLLSGRPVNAQQTEQLFVAEHTLHVWRTHAHRWQPWIDAAKGTAADISVYDLSQGDMPDEQALPRGSFDDGSLIELIEPAEVAPKPIEGSGVWIDDALCIGVGIGHDWPDAETEVIKNSLSLEPKERAAVWIMGGDAALAHAHEGRATVVVAPPGDPFWAGPYPKKAWPALSILKTDPKTGWTGAGQRAVELVNTLMEVVHDGL